MTEMNDEQIKAIEARAAAATPGPVAWQKFGKEYCLTGQYGIRPIILSADRKVGLRLRDPKRDLLVPLTPDHPDAVFYAHAREDVPRLIAALREARAEIERLKDDARDAARDGSAGLPFGSW